MTVIAYRAGIMASDSAVWSGDVMRGHTKKITRTPGGALVGAAGISSLCDTFRKWACAKDRSKSDWQGFAFGNIEAEECDFEGMIVTQSGTVITVDHLGRALVGLEAPSHAIGCGADLAIGAMLSGASAEDAVRLCIENHAFVGGRIHVEPLDPGRSPMSSKLADAFRAQLVVPRDERIVLQ